MKCLIKSINGHVRAKVMILTRLQSSEGHLRNQCCIPTFKTFAILIIKKILILLSTLEQGKKKLLSNFYDIDKGPCSHSQTAQ